jgi:hypothetical protein
MQFLISTCDIYGHAHTGDSCYTTVEPVKYWVIVISLFRFFRRFLVIVHFNYFWNFRVFSG